MRWPCARAVWRWARWRKMQLRGNRRGGNGVGVGLGESVFGKAARGIFCGETFTAGPAAAGDDVAAFGGFEAREEAMLAFAAFERGLVCAFHRDVS